MSQINQEITFNLLEDKSRIFNFRSLL